MEQELLVKEKQELLEFLLNNLSKSRNNIKSILKRGQVKVNGKVTTSFNQILMPSDKVNIIKNILENNLGLQIIYEDNYFIAIEKPAGLLSVADNSGSNKPTAFHMLSEYVKKSSPHNKIFIIHRLDKPASGILLFAKDYNTKLMIQDSWHSTVVKKYHCVVEGCIKQDKGQITSRLKENKMNLTYNDKEGKISTLEYKVLLKNSKYSLLEINLLTGRKHQIRAQLSATGYPIVGDIEYGSVSNSIKRLGLHAYYLSFIHPYNKENVILETPVLQKFKSLF